MLYGLSKERGVKASVIAGVPVTSFHRITTDMRRLRGLERNGDMVIVYDLVLEAGTNIFFVQRAMSHNCGSAIASMELATRWIIGKTLDEAAKVTNAQIIEELDLPPVKVHCSVLASDVIQAAIEDYRSKNGDDPT